MCRSGFSCGVRNGEETTPAARPPALPAPLLRRWPVPVSNFVNGGDLIRFLPEIILTITGTLLMVLDPLINRRSSNLFGTLSLVGLIAALFGAVGAYSQP